MHFAQFAILIPLFPLAAFFLIVLWANNNKRLSSSIAIGSMVLSGILSYLIFFQALAEGAEHVLEAAVHGEAPWTTMWSWAPIGLADFKVGSYMDPLAIITVVMVTTVGLMIFIYSQGYHNIHDSGHTEPLYSRFFAYLSLFASGMLGFVISPNLVQALVFWEVMGLCSFLLIGFWFGKDQRVWANGRWTTKGAENSNAAKKAFLTTRIGDVGFLLGIVGLWGIVGNIQFYELFTTSSIQRLQDSSVIIGSPTLQVPGGVIPAFGIAIPALVIIPLLLFMGSVGKSAQFPLHVWLPDAMAGPTPVSAMIHAATMVAAGVFLVARMFPLFEAAGTDGHGSLPLLIVGAVGTFTALFAGSIGVAQNDIKKILAYSTISQLGFMFAALGVGGWVAGVFHMLTHAFFKALLFLGSGSVIHGVEHGAHAAHHGHGGHDAHATDHTLGDHGEHGDYVETDDARPPDYVMDDVPDPDDPQDIMNMGGLRTRMPVTFWTYIMGTLALTGIPIWAGFWSKDEILTYAFKGGYYIIWGALTLAAFLTAFYMARQVFLVFFGTPRTQMAASAPESHRTMTIPLIVLAVFATFVGLLGMPDYIGPIHLHNWFHHFVGLVPTTGLGPEAVAHAEEPTYFNFLVAFLSIGAAVSGWALGFLLYGLRPLKAGQRDPLSRIPLVYPLLKNKYYVDEIYGATIIPLSIAFSRLNAWVDQWIIDKIVNLVAQATKVFSGVNRWVDQKLVDGAVNGIAVLMDEVNRWLRLLQTGVVQNYVLVVFMSILVLSGLYMIMR
jgi:NADH-quinone oxidoreductase subunit L